MRIHISLALEPMIFLRLFILQDKMLSMFLAKSVLIFLQQCHQVFQNIEYALQAVDLSWSNIAKMTILVVDHDAQKHAQLIQLMQQYFPQQNFPACTLIPVHCLALTQMQLEIDATAYRFKQSNQSF